MKRLKIDDYNCIINTYIPRMKSNPEKVQPESNIDRPLGELGLIDIVNKKAKLCKKTSKERHRLYCPIADFLLSLKTYDVPAYEQFAKLYPQLTSGSTFNPFLGFDIVELYESVINSIKSKGV
ncbi:MAG: DUF4007 family protein [Oscillospiraceae bacterium]|nr:DUF4007 family protein [Oscillospiraceae bacterium]